MITNITAFIISGGKSSRMQSDKGTLIYKGISFIDSIMDSITKNKIPTKIISNNPKHKNFGVMAIKDITPNMGPVGGIATALNNTETELNLILSCDIPLMNADCLKWIIESHKQNYDATVVVVKNKKMPLAGIYNKKCKPIFLEYLEEKKLKLLNVIDQLTVNYINCPKHLEHCFFNVNTKEDFKQINDDM